MSPLMSNAELETENLQQDRYNSTVTKIIRMHDDLAILRVQLDSGVPRFSPGQFTILGLGSWEPCPGSVQDSSGPDPAVLIKRPYSISCSLLDDNGRLVRADETPYLEFYVAQIHPADSSTLTLTPRLFALREGDRLFCSTKPRGSYTLGTAATAKILVFASTGTGEAPHNAMIAELLSHGFSGQMVSVVCARRKRDLGYAAVHRELERRFPNYRYAMLTTQEPENIVAGSPGFRGKRYLQDYFRSGDFERDTGIALLPENTHVFLCGNPKMIGRPLADRQAADLPLETGMIEILEQRQFHLNRPSSPGNIHIEKYW